MLKLSLLSRIAFILVLCFCFSNCATIVNSKKDNTLFISTTPEGASIYNSNNKLLGKSPLQVKYSDLTPDLRVEKEGYLNSRITISKSYDKKFLLLDAMLLCIPCPVDFATGALVKYEPNNIELNLIKEYTAEEKISLIVKDINYNYNSKFPSPFQEGLRVGSLKRSFCRFSSNFYFNTDDCNSNRKMFSMSHVYLTVEVIDADKKVLNKKQNKSKYLMQVEWKFSRSASGEPFATYITDATVQNSGTDNEGFGMAMEAAFAKLLSDDKVYTILKEETEKSFIAQNQNLDIIKINYPRFDRLRDMIGYTSQSVVTVENSKGHGSGFFITENGLLITNYHVIEDDVDNIKVMLNNGPTLKATVVRTNAEFDLAILQVEGTGYKPLILAAEETFSLGEDVYAIGTPLDKTLSQTVTKGIISGFRRVLDVNLIQTDVSINPGNSGGPIVLEDGRVAAIITFKLSGNTAGIGFGIPAAEAIKILNLTYTE